MLAFTARASALLPLLLSNVNAELHSRSTSAHLHLAAPFAGAQKRALLGDVACALGVTSACDASGIDTKSDSNNCGWVGHVCPSTYYLGVPGSVTCVDSLCTPVCIAGHAFSRDLSLCVNLSTDVRNCGTLGNACAVPSGTATCVEGECNLAFCDPGYREDTTTGTTCIPDDYQTDVRNCGGEGNRCVVGVGGLGVTCSAGACRSTECSAGFTLVDGECKREQQSAPNSPDTQSDPENCGGVNRQCPTSYANGSGSICVAGECQPDSCNTGYAFDSTISACRQVSSDPQNCGAVGKICTAVGGTAGCQDGSCTVVSCESPLQLVDGICTGSPSASARARARVKKRQASKPVKLCPGNESACPIVGSATYATAKMGGFQAFRTQNEAKMLAAGGYECLDTDYTLESCGGCASMGQGLNCASIPHSSSVGCASGQCMVFSCKVGFKPTWNAKGCTRAPTPSRFRRSHVKRECSRRSRRAAARKH